MQYAPTLASFAKRLINTVANSAAAERAFSAMNLQHTKLRNSLPIEKVEKLLFIQINKKQMRDETPENIQPEELLEAENEELERLHERDQQLTRYLYSLGFDSIEPIGEDIEDNEASLTPTNPLKRALEWPEGVGEAAAQPAQRPKYDLE
jgi:hypothetical protein